MAMKTYKCEHKLKEAVKLKCRKICKQLKSKIFKTVQTVHYGIVVMMMLAFENGAYECVKSSIVGHSKMALFEWPESACELRAPERESCSVCLARSSHSE